MLYRPKRGQLDPSNDPKAVGSKNLTERQRAEARKALSLKKISRSDLFGKFLLPRVLRRTAS